MTTASGRSFRCSTRGWRVGPSEQRFARRHNNPIDAHRERQSEGALSLAGSPAAHGLHQVSQSALRVERRRGPAQAQRPPQVRQIRAAKRPVRRKTQTAVARPAEQVRERREQLGSRLTVCDGVGREVDTDFEACATSFAYACICWIEALTMAPKTPLMSPATNDGKFTAASRSSGDRTGFANSRDTSRSGSARYDATRTVSCAI